MHGIFLSTDASISEKGFSCGAVIIYHRSEPGYDLHADRAPLPRLTKFLFYSLTRGKISDFELISGIVGLEYLGVLLGEAALGEPASRRPEVTWFCDNEGVRLQAKEQVGKPAHTPLWECFRAVQSPLLVETQPPSSRESQRKLIACDRACKWLSTALYRVQRVGHEGPIGQTSFHAPQNAWQVADLTAELALLCRGDRAALRQKLARLAQTAR